MDASSASPKPVTPALGRLPADPGAKTARLPSSGPPLTARLPTSPTGAAPGGASGKKAAGAHPALVALNWAEQDIENRWGIVKGGRYTSVNKLVSFVFAGLCSAVFLSLAFLCYRGSPGPLHRLAEFFVRPGNLFATGPATFCFFWGAVIVLFKFPKLRLQQHALHLAAVPQNPDFVLNEATAKTVLERMRGLADDPKHFILLNRIDRALSNLHNIGGVSDVSTILKSQADNDENQIASSYALINAMIWAIPVLGFIGTVLGLSVAINKFTAALRATTELNVIKASLQEVTAGLSTAFETTLVGLVFALFLHLLSDLMQERETDFLDECNDYCHAHVVSKLRVNRGQPPS
jgi:biopolymer transport protein ExbB/TolQ